MIKPVPDEGNFYEITKDTILEKRHADFVKDTVKEYEEYKNYFSKVFIEMPSRDFYKFKVNYLLKQPVWREIIIANHQTFFDLADEIIYSMNWDNDHMHGFGFPFKRGKLTEWYVSPYTIYAPGWEDDPIPTYKSNQVKIGEIDWLKFPKLRFTFDYGDNHEFDVLYQGTTKLPEGINPKDLPMTIDQRGVAPEQYPPFEEDSEVGGHENWFHDDCKLCQELKKSGAEMQWIPDNFPKKEKVVN